MPNEERVILACIDGSPASEAVCDYAAWIGKKVVAPLKLLHTIEHQKMAQTADYSGAIGLGSREDLLIELTTIEQNRSRLMIEKGRLMLDAAKSRVCDAGIEFPELCQRHGSLVESLIELENKTRVLVLGIRGESHAAQNSGVGTQLESVIRALHKPILVVNEDFREPKTVMLAYDGSPACKKALNMVASSPLFNNIHCHVVHVGEDGGTFLDAAQKLLRAANISAATAQLTGKIEDELVRYQSENDIDLMLMGAFSHNRVRDFLLGSFTEKMLATTHRPLLLLR